MNQGTGTTMPKLDDTDSDPRSDAALVRACNEGGEVKQRAMSILWRRHHDFVLRVARRYTSDEATAEDAVQDVFEYLFRRLTPGDAGIKAGAKRTTLLYMVAEHAALAASRRMRRCEICGVNPDDLSGPPNPDGRGMIADLSPVQREAIHLRFGEDCPYCEAERQNMSLGTVKARIHDAIDRWRQLAAVHEVHV